MYIYQLKINLKPEYKYTLYALNLLFFCAAGKEFLNDS